jgi:hypothetical protein
MSNDQRKYLFSSKRFKRKGPKKMIWPLLVFQPFFELVFNATTQRWIWPLIICQIEQSKNLYTKFFFTNMVCKFNQIKLVYIITQCHFQ